MPRIVCPSCGARYDVAAGVIGAAGKNVRCARCGTVWLARPEPAEGETLLPQWPEPPPPKVRDLEDEEPLPPPPRRKEAPPAPSPVVTPVEDEPEVRPTRARRGGAGATIAWVVTLVLIAGAGYGAVRYPHAVIDAWPASARLFTMLGLAP
jgi:predicted Zn finger-like uncharacterized protein